MGDMSKPLKDEDRERRDDLVLGLFKEKSEPFFDRNSFSLTLLDEFVNREEVLAATDAFANTLMRLWSESYPDTPGLRLRSRSSGNICKTYVPPDLSDSAEPACGPSPDSKKAKPMPNFDLQGESHMPRSDQENPPGPARADSIASSQSDSALGSFPDTKPKSPPGSVRPGAIPSTGMPAPHPPAPKATFVLPNAKVGVTYAESLQGRDQAGDPVSVVEVRLPEGLGLGFDPDRGEVSGTPAHEGDYRIPLRWTLDGKEFFSGDCLLIVNPNNPDGRQIEASRLIELANKLHKQRGLLIVDEAFADVVPDNSIVSQLGELPNTVVLRSYGKFFGMSGIRLGFLLGHEVQLSKIRDMLGPWAVSTPALRVGTQSLNDIAWQEQQRAFLIGRAEKLDAVLEKRNLYVAGGTPLFRLVINEEARALHRALAEMHIWTRIFDYRADFMRIGIPIDDEALERLDEALGKVSLR